MIPGSKARRTRPEKSRAIYRLSNTVRLPWAVGLVLLLLLALLAGLFLGRSREDLRVPQAVLDAQEIVTRGAANSVRRSTNEGISASRPSRRYWPRRTEQGPRNWWDP